MLLTPVIMSNLPAQLDIPALVRQRLAATAAVHQAMSQSAGEPLERAARMVADSLSAGGTLLFAGNGGSAAESQHFAAEMVGRLQSGHERRPLRAIALTTDTSALTAIGNDYGYDLVFERQLQAISRPGDVLVVMSTSGNSPNLVKAVQAAAALQVRSIALVGEGGVLPQMADVALCVPSGSTQHIQEGHLSLGHLLCEIVERLLFPGEWEA